MLGFTRQERAIVLFLGFSLLLGTAVTLYNRFWARPTVVHADAAAVEQFQRLARTVGAQAAKIDSSGLASEPQPGRSERADKTVRSESLLININRATMEELQRIPRVGPVLAQRIIDYRAQNGEFVQLSDLKKVKGIGEGTLRKMEPYVSVK